MQNNLPKKVWRPQISLKESSEIMIDWCIRAREKNILLKKPPQIFYSFIVEGNTNLQFFNNISSLFKYSQKDLPSIDLARDSLLRCLSVALKSHFFIFSNENVEYEPYYFSFPNLENHAQNIFGLIYKINNENKTIIVCEKNLDSLFEKNKIIFQFPAVVIEDSFKWFSMKNWNKIKQESSFDFLEKPWLNKKVQQSIQEAHTKEELEKVAHILDVPYEIKNIIKPLGIEWSKKLNTWCLPKGFDIDSVIEFIEYTKKDFQKNNPIKN